MSEFAYYEMNDESDNRKINSTEPARTYRFKGDSLKYIAYTQSMKELIAICQNGNMCKIPIAAEKHEYELEDEPEGKKKKAIQKEYSAEPISLGDFHQSSIVFCEEAKGSNKLVVISSNGLISFIDMVSKKTVQSIRIQGKVTCATINTFGNNLYVGTQGGCIRIFDISDLKNAALIFSKKVHKKKALFKLRISPDNSTLAYLTADSNK